MRILKHKTNQPQIETPSISLLDSLDSFGQHLSNRKDVGSVVVWIMFRLSNTAIGYAHDVGPIPKRVLFVVFSVWLALIDFCGR